MEGRELLVNKFTSQHRLLQDPLGAAGCKLAGGVACLTEYFRIALEISTLDDPCQTVAS